MKFICKEETWQICLVDRSRKNGRKHIDFYYVLFYVIEIVVRIPEFRSLSAVLFQRPEPGVFELFLILYPVL
jgi:hypothetical protein